jgi:hypothetical protein
MPDPVLSSKLVTTVSAVHTPPLLMDIKLSVEDRPRSCIDDIVKVDICIHTSTNAKKSDYSRFKNIGKSENQPHRTPPKFV